MNDVVEKTDENAVVKPATKVMTPINTVRDALTKMQSQFQTVLPKHLTPERMVRVAMTAIQNTPKLLDCDRQSLYGAIMRSAQLGLEPDGVLGQAYLIPFKRSWKDGNEWKSKMEVQFIPGYKGLIDLARRSGEVSNIIAKEVYAQDEFDVDWSKEMPFIHKPKLGGARNPEDVVYFWAMARFKDGGFHWDYMTRQEVEAIRDKGNGGKNAVWKDYFIEMGKKTAIRRIAKYLPMSVQKASATEDLLDSGKSFTNNEYGDIVIDQDGAGAVVENEEAVATEKRLGNDAAKDKLKKQKPDVEPTKEQRAADAGADPSTGEITGNPPKPPFNTKLIPTGIKAGTSQPDFAKWEIDFARMCNSAPTVAKLVEFHENNKKILLQFATFDPARAEYCGQVYNDALTELQLREQA